LERIDYDPTDTLKEINVLTHSIGMFAQNAGTNTFVIDNDSNIWN